MKIMNIKVDLPTINPPKNGLCGGKEMRGFLRIKQGIQSLYGTLLFPLLLFGLIVPRFLRGLPLMRYILIG